MEILLIVTVIAVAASGLYVAVTFNRRTEQNTAPLVNIAIKDISKRFEDISKDLGGQLQAITDQLQREEEQIDQNRSRNQERLDRADRRISSIADQFSAELDTIKHLGGQISTLQERFSGDLQQSDHHAAQLAESVARLSAHVAEIKTYIKSRETQTIADIKSVEGSLQDIGARQSEAHDKLASITRKLDRQTEMNTQSEDNDHWVAEQMLGTIRQIEAVLRRQSVIESHLRAMLDYEVVRTSHDHKCRIVTASLRLSGPGADLVWPLLLSFSETVMFKTVLLESPRPAVSRSYLLWQSSGGLQLEEVLCDKLAACTDNPASPNPDLEELRSLVLGLHGAGPGTIQLGPKIINSTPRALLGCARPPRKPRTSVTPTR